MRKLIVAILFLFISYNLFSQLNRVFTFPLNDKYYTNISTACIQLHVTAPNKNYIVVNCAYNYSDFPSLNYMSMGNYISLKDTSNSLYDIKFSLTGLCAKFDTADLPKNVYKEIPGQTNYYYNDTAIIYEVCPNLNDFRKSLLVLIKRVEKDEIIKLDNYLWFINICKSIEIYNCCETIDY